MIVISQIQKAILDSFGQIPDSEYFYLTGGTALAYFYLKHRKSNDLDFFTAEEEIILPFSRRMEETLKNEGMIVRRQRGFHSFVELVVKLGEEDTVVHLAQDAPFRFEQPKEFPSHPKLKVDSLLDIAANKLLALFSRATLRDFIDIYFLIKKANFTIEKLMKVALEKDSGFDLYWLGVALERIKTFKNDAPEMLLLIERVNIEDLVVFFNQWREKITKELKL